MRQLTSLDAQFLALETPRIYGHVTGVLVLDPSTAPGGTLSLGDLQKLILDRLPLIPIFKWRLAEVPFGLDFGYWVDDPDFDIDFHVRELALVPPGSMAQLEEQVARIFSRPLDRSRPLWEIYLIHGLETRPRGADDQGAPRRDRRALRRGDPRVAARPHPRGPPGARAGARRTRTACRRSSRCSREA